MDIKELHKDLHKALLEDPKYNQLLKSIKNEDEKSQLEAFMKNFMNYFQREMFDPLVERSENDPQFMDALAKKMEKLIPNKKSE